MTYMKSTLALICLLLSPLDAVNAQSPKKPAAQAKADEFYTPPRDKAGLKNDAPVDKSLPNVLILGDSISIGYTRQVREGLKGKANVIRPSDNCGDTRIGLAKIDKWLGDTKWSVIHFNWGLWDLCYRNPKSTEQGHRDKVHGKLTVSLEDYEKNLETLVRRMERTGAKLIWASTTVVPEGEAGHFAGDDAKYNAVAERVMKKHRVMIDDLYAVTKAFSPNEFNGRGDVHYKPEASAKLAAQVVSKVEEALKDQPRPARR